jgi:hypothetical protein
MKDEAIRFISEVIKPWETLNQQFAAPFSMNPAVNDFITIANALTVSIKHLPEAFAKIKPEFLANEQQSYEIISDLADSLKHGELRKRDRECKLSVSSMFERNEKAEVRFLRNRISIQHNTYGKIDFMECALESAIFIAEKLDIKTDWNPKIFNNSGEFSNEIIVHAPKKHQVIWTGMAIETVRLNEDGKYENVDLNGQVMFTLTCEI